MQNIRQAFYKPIKLILIGLSFIFLPHQIFAQSMADNPCSNCKILDQVQVFGISNERFMAGLKIQRFDSITVAQNKHQTLDEFLQTQTSISIKPYGAGQLSTISFRGTAATHTAILWNGLSINSPNLGLTDLSVIPMQGFNQIAVQYGSSASTIGSGAVGGSIALSSIPDFNTNKNSFNVSGQLGFIPNDRIGNYKYNTALLFFKSIKRATIQSRTVLYGSNTAYFLHSFPNSVIKDKTGYSYNIEPSQTMQKGLTQDFYVKFKHDNPSIYRLLFLNIWLTDNQLTIQPKIEAFKEFTQTQAHRVLLGFQLNQTSLKIGAIRDILDYSKGNYNSIDHAKTDRLILKFEHDFSWKHQSKISSVSHTNLKIGSEFVHYRTLVDGYQTGSEIYENRGDLYALLRKSFGWKDIEKKVIVSINLRKSLSNLYKPPFTPALGLNFNCFTNEKTKVIANASVSKSYRLPTLNERYWHILGNPTIQPEIGINKEIGFDISQQLNKVFSSLLNLTAYHHLIDNWTYWNPDKNYRVENLQQVLSKGIEFSSLLSYTRPKSNYSFRLAYALTDVSQQKTYDAYSINILGKQLIYVPRHVVNTQLQRQSNKWRMGIQASYYGRRFITFDHSGRSFPPYVILNSNLSYQMVIKKQESSFIFQANNLTNSIYPNIKRNAMPGINFQLSFNIKFS